MTVYVTRYQGSTLGHAQVTNGAPLANQASASSAGTIETATQLSEIWEISSSGDHTVTFGGKTMFLQSGYFDKKGVIKDMTLVFVS